MDQTSSSETDFESHGGHPVMPHGEELDKHADQRLSDEGSEASEDTGPWDAADECSDGSSEEDAFEKQLFSMQEQQEPDSEHKVEGQEEETKGVPRQRRRNKERRRSESDGEERAARLSAAIDASRRSAAFLLVVPLALCAARSATTSPNIAALLPFQSYSAKLVFSFGCIALSVCFLVRAGKRMIECRSRDRLLMGARTSGLAFPWHAWQLLVLALFFPVLFVVQSVAFPLFSALHPSAARLLGDVHWVMVIAVVALWLYLGVTDPADPPSEDAIGNEHTFCSYCDAWFNTQNRRHCHQCNRCVSGFDHHCNYLNICIGRKNYKAFFALVIFTMICSGMYLMMSFYLFFTLFLSNDVIAFSMAHLGWELSVLLVLALLGASMGTMFLFGNLCLFHTFLTQKGTTTFEYWDNEYDDVIALRREWQMAIYDADLTLGIMHTWTSYSLRVHFNQLLERFREEVAPQLEQAVKPSSSSGLWWGDSESDSARPSPRPSPLLSPHMDPTVPSPGLSPRASPLMRSSSSPAASGRLNGMAALREAVEEEFSMNSEVWWDDLEEDAEHRRSSGASIEASSGRPSLDQWCGGSDGWADDEPSWPQPGRSRRAQSISSDGLLPWESRGTWERDSDMFSLSSSTTTSPPDSTRYPEEGLENSPTASESCNVDHIRARLGECCGGASEKPRSPYKTRAMRAVISVASGGSQISRSRSRMLNMNRSRSAEIVMSGDHRDRAEKWASSSVVKGGPVGARTPTLSGRGTMQRLLIKKGVFLAAPKTPPSFDLVDSASEPDEDHPTSPNKSPGSPTRVHRVRSANNMRALDSSSPPTSHGGLDPTIDALTLSTAQAMDIPGGLDGDRDGTSSEPRPLNVPLNVPLNGRSSEPRPIEREPPTRLRHRPTAPFERMQQDYDLDVPVGSCPW